MKKKYSPHEPEEELLSAADTLKNAEQSEARWQTFERDQRLCRMLVALPEPAFSKLEKLAGRAGGLLPIL